METWEGKNKMGQILMEIRDELEQGDEMSDNELSDDLDISNIQDADRDGSVNESDTDSDHDVDKVGKVNESGPVSTHDADRVSESNPGSTQDADEVNEFEPSNIHDAGGVENENIEVMVSNGMNISKSMNSTDNDSSMLSDHQDITARSDVSSISIHEASIDVTGEDDVYNNDGHDYCADEDAGENIEGDGEQDEYGTDGKYVLLIGDSNCRDVLLDPPFKVDRQVISGTAIFDIDNLITESTVPAKQVSAVIIHVGTCDFDPTKKNPVDAMYLEYVECVNGITDMYSNADVVISSILPRAPRKDCTYSQLNTEIMLMNRILTVIMMWIRLENNKLCKLESDASHIMFIDNYCKFMNNDDVRQELYKAHDKTGVHVNSRGAETLTQTFLRGLREAHFKRKLQQEYDVVPATSNA